MENLDGYYRVLGLEPRAAPEEVKAAYRDLAQVWHPDRFAHDDRLREKASENLSRINEAYAKLKDVKPSAASARRVSRLSDTYQAIVGMGDMVRSSFAEMRKPKPRGQRIVGLNPQGKRRKQRRSPRQIAIYVVGVTAALLTVVGILYLVGT